MKYVRWIILSACFPLYASAQTDTVQFLRTAQASVRAEQTESSVALNDSINDSTGPDSIIHTTIQTVYFYTDTLFQIISAPDSISRQREIITHADSSERRGHYLEAYIGAGYGSLGYTLSGADNHVTGFANAVLQAQYAYFFHPNWGIGAGVWFTNYASHVQLGGVYQWKGQTDTDLETDYDHSSQVIRWRENEIIHNAGVPVSLQFQYQKEDWRVRLFAALGVAPSVSVMKSYRVTEGVIAHSGYYPEWNLTLTDMHEFQTKHYEQDPCAKGSLSVRPQATLFADFGVLFPIGKQIDLMIGAYAHYTANDANSSAKKNLGWKDETFTFMEEYKGVYATDLTSASHPWAAGVKIGLHWHHIAPDKHMTVDYFDYFTRRDTTIEFVSRNDTIITERTDTMARAHIAKAAEEVEKLNKIYFDYDSYRLSDESKAYLSSIISILNKVPDAKIAIDGHASEEGQRLHNERLAYNRAKEVAKFLITNGIEKERVIVIGHGSLVPNEENIHHELPLDRRAEVKIVQKQSDLE